MLETAIAEAQSELAEAVETAQELSGYEPDEDKKVSATVIKKVLKELIDEPERQRRRFRQEGTQEPHGPG